MKAAIVEAPGKIVIRDLPVPKPNPYQALVRMAQKGLEAAQCAVEMANLLKAVK